MPPSRAPLLRPPLPPAPHACLPQAKLRLLNTGSRAVRVNILNPTTPYFRVSFEKLGGIAPGMAETVTVEFTPTEARYYYDCIRIQARVVVCPPTPPMRWF